MLARARRAVGRAVGEPIDDPFGAEQREGGLAAAGGIADLARVWDAVSVFPASGPFVKGTLAEAGSVALDIEMAVAPSDVSSAWSPACTNDCQCAPSLLTAGGSGATPDAALADAPVCAITIGLRVRRHKVVPRQMRRTAKPAIRQPPWLNLRLSLRIPMATRKSRQDSQKVLRLLTTRATARTYCNVPLAQLAQGFSTMPREPPFVSQLDTLAA